MGEDGVPLSSAGQSEGSVADPHGWGQDHARARRSLHLRGARRLRRQVASSANLTLSLKFGEPCDLL